MSRWKTGYCLIPIGFHNVLCLRLLQFNSSNNKLLIHKTLPDNHRHFPFLPYMYANDYVKCLADITFTSNNLRFVGPSLLYAYKKKLINVKIHGEIKYQLSSITCNLSYQPSIQVAPNKLNTFLGIRQGISRKEHSY